MFGSWEGLLPCDLMKSSRLLIGADLYIFNCLFSRKKTDAKAQRFIDIRTYLRIKQGTKSFTLRLFDLASDFLSLWMC